MECERCNDHLSAYADDALSGRERRQVRSHLETCRRCREDLAEIRTLSALLRATPDPEPSPSFWAETYSTVRKRGAAPPRPAPLLHGGFGWGVALASVFVFLLMMPPRRINRAPIPPTPVAPAELISLHARLRSDQPLADSGSIHYALADPDGADENAPFME